MCLEGMVIGLLSVLRYNDGFRKIVSDAGVVGVGVGGGCLHKDS